MSTLAFLGNLMLGRSVNSALRRDLPESVWGTTLPLLRSAQAVIANLECAITLQPATEAPTPRALRLRADPEAVDLLRAGNIRCVSLANDHTFDYGEEGLFDTLDALDRAGIAHTGAGRTLGRAAAPAIVKLPGLRAGVVGLTDADPAQAATMHAAGTHYADLDRAPVPHAGLAELAANCRARRADVAILSVHWGLESAPAPWPHFREIARAAIEAGFDLVHGHSAHTFHGIEIHRGRPILYGTGDFLHEPAVDERLPNEGSFAFLADLDSQKRIERIRLIPVRWTHARVDLAAREESRAICGRMIDRCTALGTHAIDIDGVVVIDCSTPAEHRLAALATAT
jgi:poly-gamma-glutamate capsule biosynthesis protein CapA/YwtB (metallophosphatase superfamily)